MEDLLSLLGHDFSGMRGFHRFLGYDALPWYYEILEEKMDDYRSAYAVVDAFFVIDGLNLVSEGEQEAFEWTQKVVEKYNSPASLLAIEYLTRKGDANTHEFLQQCGHDSPKLEMRIQGINIFESVEGRWHAPWYEKLRFIPSVTNMGAQAMYVREILKHYWERMGKDASQIPDDLLTMVVSFDSDGNPVCNVDLSKYGLSMPIIDPKPDKHYRGDHTVTFPHEANAEPSPPPAANPPPDPAECGASLPTCERTIPPNLARQETRATLWLYAAAGILLLAIAALLLRKKGKTNH